MELLKQFNDALTYIDENLTGDISFDEAAKIACCSTYYFQRMFAYLAGIPISEYIRRRRMTAAAFDLQRGDERITEIAIKYGYQSPTSFNRAFQSIHGIAPSAVWRGNNVLTTYPKLQFNVSINGDKKIQYRIETKEPIRIIGFNIPLAYDMENNFIKVQNFWRSFKDNPNYEKIKDLNDSNPLGILGATIYENTDSINYMIGTASSQPTTDDMSEILFPESIWVIFPFGNPAGSEVQELYRYFYTEWLPTSGYRYEYGPDLEVYNANASTSSLKHELWMCIKKSNHTNFYSKEV